ncbi:LppA family lipoprotein [Mycobacterium sp. NPDC006124]|uniref:LppA family lipoprotein n=1 Tax=Mycobacterium sp. NPDC006124 TaxID=3156729 RepID=UPI0033B60CD8
MPRVEVRGRITLGTMAITLLATGCHMNQPDSPTPATSSIDAVDQLKALPSLEDTKMQVQGAMDEITAAASRVIPTLQWSPLHGETPNGCGAPFDQTDGQSVFLPDLTAGADVTDQQWQVILTAGRESAAKIGATNMQVMQDGPSNHDVGFYGPAGISIKIGYQGNLVVSGNTGCRLPKAVK